MICEIIKRDIRTIGLIFIVLKLLSLVSWSWWIVSIPHSLNFVINIFTEILNNKKKVLNYEI